MSDHPYRHLDPQAYWSQAVAAGLDLSDLVRRDEPLLRSNDRVASIGSCFASNLIPYIEAAGFTYVRAERPEPLVAHLPENLGYQKFSAAYGNVYTVRQMLQLVRRALGEFRPAEDRWYADDAVIDPYRPGLAYPATTDLEFDLLTRAHLAATRTAFETATVVVMTLGLTEAWQSRIDHAVFPACPGTIAGAFDPERHQFVNFGVAETIDDLHALIAAVRSINPSMRFILTVSPVPLVATASGKHVLEATTYSKSVLRVAAGHVADREADVAYFPAYEIVTGPQASFETFGPDRRSVSDAAIAEVMGALLAASESAVDSLPATTTGTADVERPVDLVTAASRAVAEAECDEELLDPNATR